MANTVLAWITFLLKTTFDELGPDSVSLLTT